MRGMWSGDREYTRVSRFLWNLWGSPKAELKEREEGMEREEEEGEVCRSDWMEVVTSRYRLSVP